MEAICDPVSLYEPIFSDAGENATVMDQIGDTKNTDEQWLEQIALEEAMRRLSKRESESLALRFYDGRTQMEVAKAVGISQAQVSRLEKNAISQIKRISRPEALLFAPARMSRKGYAPAGTSLSKKPVRLFLTALIRRAF